MSDRKKVIVVMPAYNAEKTLVATYDEVPKDVVDHVILVAPGICNSTQSLRCPGPQAIDAHTANR